MIISDADALANLLIVKGDIYFGDMYLRDTYIRRPG